jgi:hypothetical protein
MTKRRLVFLVAAAALLGFAVLVFLEHDAVYFKNRIARLQERLEAERTVPCVQAWLASHDVSRLPVGDPSVWPECVRSVKPFRVRDLADGGLSLEWYGGDLIAIDIYPAGRRPFREPREDYYGYLAPYGADSYVRMTFK